MASGNSEQLPAEDTEASTDLPTEGPDAPPEETEPTQSPGHSSRRWSPGTKSIILSSIALVISFVALVLLTTAYMTATYYHRVCFPPPPNTTYANAYFKDYACEQKSPGTYDECLLWQDIYDKNQSDLVEIPPSRPECPSKWIFVTAFYLQVTGWLATATRIIAVALLGKKKPRIYRGAGIVGVGFAVVSLVCFLCYLTFFVLMVGSNEWCSPGKYVYTEHNAEECGEDNVDQFQPWLLLAGLLVTGLAVLAKMTASLTMAAVVVKERPGAVVPEGQPQGKQKGILAKVYKKIS